MSKKEYEAIERLGEVVRKKGTEAAKVLRAVPFIPIELEKEFYEEVFRRYAVGTITGKNVGSPLAMALEEAVRMSGGRKDEEVIRAWIKRSQETAKKWRVWQRDTYERPGLV